jgi:hypothetical protein
MANIDTREKRANGCMMGAEGFRQSIKSKLEARTAVDAMPREFEPL